MNRNTSLEKETRTKTEKIMTLTVDTKKLDDELSRCNVEVSKVKKVLKVKEKESHKLQTKVDNLEDTLAKNKLEKTALILKIVSKVWRRKLGKIMKDQNWPKSRRKCKQKLPRFPLPLQGKNLEMWKKL
jgi:predicted nuclease with TOPRIM domain